MQHPIHLNTSTPNVLYIVLEDFSTLASPVFSSESAPAARRTPHLQQLAARGVVFLNTFCQSPICNPSRSSFMTSRRPSATGVWSNEDRLLPGLPTMVDFLRRSDPAAAVACAGRGKIFHVACDRDPRGFTNGETELEADAHKARVAERTLRVALHRGGTASFAHRAVRNTLNSTPRHRRTKDQDKAKVAVRLLAYYAAIRTRFFLAVGLASTHVHGHRICLPGAYDLEAGQPISTSFPLPLHRGSETDPPLVTWPNWDVPRFDVGDRWQREVLGHYYACATHVDAQIGALTGALDALELSVRTVVVVQGDHGFSLGRHGRWSKYNLYEDSTRVPLLIAAPGLRRPATVQTVVESLDIMPTLLDLWGVDRVSSANGGARLAMTPAPASPDAGLSPPPPPLYNLGGSVVPLEGESLVPLMPLRAGGLSVGSGPAAPHTWQRRRRYALSELREWMLLNRPTDKMLPGALPRRLLGYGWQLYVRAEDFAYTAYLRPTCHSGCVPGRLMPAGTRYRLIDEALFDRRSDPGERANLAYQAAHASTRWALLQTALHEWKVHIVGPMNMSRSERLEWLERQATATVTKEPVAARPRAAATAHGHRRRAERRGRFR